MAQDEVDETVEAAVPKHRYLLLAGVAGACALGVGLGLWARPAIGERGETPKVAAAPEPPPPGERKLQIVFDENPAPIGKPLEVMAPHPDAAPAARILPAPLPVTSLATPRPTPSRPPNGLMRADAPRLAEPVLGDRAPAPSFAERARPFAHTLIVSAEAALLRIAEIRPEPQAGEAVSPAEPAAAAAARKHAEAAVLAEQRKRAEAERMARLEARKAAQAEARARRAARLEAAAEARAEQLAVRAGAERKAERLAETARAQALAKAERRKAERLAAQARAREKAEALAEARAEARARALAEAKAKAKAEALAEAKARALAEARTKARAEAVAEAKAEARRRKTVAILAHALARAAAAHRAKAAPEPPRPLKGAGSIRLVSAPRCASSDPGAALACADPELGAAERRMNRAYQQAEAAGVPAAELHRQQERWLATRAAAAREAPWAVRDVYQARIAELEDLARNPHD